MLNLIRLELRKNKLHRYLKVAALANLGFIALLCTIYFAERSEGTNAYPTYMAAASIMDSMTKTTFMIFASVLIAKLIIEEYRSKTITLLFMYPINRKKLMASKLIIVFVFAFMCMMLSNTLLQSLLYAADLMYDIVPESLTWEGWLHIHYKLLLSSLSGAGISLITLYFGMRKKSVPAAIVSAIILNAILSLGGDAVSLGSIPIVSMSLAAIGILIAYLSFKDVDTQDVV